jgi:triacylglycerol lipase
LRALLSTLALLVLVPSCGQGEGTPNGRDGGTRDASVDAREPHDANRDAAPRPDAGPPRDAGRPHTLGPPYPIVFAHGFFGFEDFAGIDFVQYFFGVGAALEAAGETNVYFPAVDPFNTSEVRGAQLAAAIEAILDETGYRQVNVIAHSQGGLDARVVAHDHPEWIASVTTIATPHGGTRLSDVLDELITDPRLREALDAIASLVLAPLYEADGSTSSVWLGLDQFNTPNITAFNAAYPDSHDVYYYSIGGRSSLASGGDDCNVTGRPELITRWDSDRDPVDVLLSVPAAIVGEDTFNPIPNDGLVSVPSSRHGIFLGCIPADHLDEMGQLLGDAPGGFNRFDHRVFYTELVAYLRGQGL